MKTFYLLRSEDVHGNSGTGVVAEGIIYDTGMCAMTWLTEIATVTVFRRIQDVVKLHGHEGKTQIIVEGNRRHRLLFDECKFRVKMSRIAAKVQDETKEVT